MEESEQDEEEPKQDGELVEERVTEEVEEAATGRRWRLSVVMIVLGVGAIAAGIHWKQDVLIVGGVVAIIIFALVAAGSKGITLSLAEQSASANLPQRKRVRTTVRQDGFPKKARRENSNENGQSNGRLKRLRERLKSKR